MCRELWSEAGGMNAMAGGGPAAIADARTRLAGAEGAGGAGSCQKCVGVTSLLPFTLDSALQSTATSCWFFLLTVA